MLDDFEFTSKTAAIIAILFAVFAAFVLMQVFTKGWFYRRVVGGHWQKIWYRHSPAGGYEIWVRSDLSAEEWEVGGGRVIDEESN